MKLWSIPVLQQIGIYFYIQPTQPSFTQQKKQTKHDVQQDRKIKQTNTPETHWYLETGMIFRRQFSHFGASRAPLEFVDWVVVSPNPIVSKKHDLPKQHQANLGVTRLVCFGTTQFKPFFVNDFTDDFTCTFGVFFIAVVASTTNFDDFFGQTVERFPMKSAWRILTNPDDRQVTNRCCQPHACHGKSMERISLQGDPYVNDLTIKNQDLTTKKEM